MRSNRKQRVVENNASRAVTSLTDHSITSRLPFISQRKAIRSKVADGDQSAVVINLSSENINAELTTSSILLSQDVPPLLGH